MSESSPKLVRKDPLRLYMGRCGQMVTDAAIFASEAIKLEPGAVQQLCDAASLPPARKVLATADIHVGFGIPIGAVLGLDNAIISTPTKLLCLSPVISLSARARLICRWIKPASRLL
ncbi:MAG: hypothetical protein ACYSU5_17710 [Planctomycetota bacterium]